MIHFAQNNDIIIGVDFGHGNDIAVKTTAKVHEDGRLRYLCYARILGCSKRLVVRRWLMNGMKMCRG